MTTELRVARIVCTPKELDAIILRHAGRTQREIAHALDVSRRTIQHRLHNADRKIAQYLDRKEQAA